MPFFEGSCKKKKKSWRHKLLEQVWWRALSAIDCNLYVQESLFSAPLTLLRCSENENIKGLCEQATWTSWEQKACFFGELCKILRAQMTNPELNKELIIQRKIRGQKLFGTYFFPVLWFERIIWRVYRNNQWQHGTEFFRFIAGRREQEEWAAGMCDAFSSWFIESGQPTFLVLPLFPSCVPVVLFVGINYDVMWVNYLKFLCKYGIIIYCCPPLTFLAWLVQTSFDVINELQKT